MGVPEGASSSSYRVRSGIVILHHLLTLRNHSHPLFSQTSRPLGAHVDSHHISLPVTSGKGRQVQLVSNHPRTPGRLHLVLRSHRAHSREILHLMLQLPARMVTSPPVLHHLVIPNHAVRCIARTNISPEHRRNIERLVPSAGGKRGTDVSPYRAALS